jgi:hypothetical protein
LTADVFNVADYIGDRTLDTADIAAQRLDGASE